MARVLALELSGEPYDRDHRYGEVCKSSIARTIEEAFFQEFNGRLTMDQMLKNARKYEPFIQDYSPEIAEEQKGMADGSGRSCNEIVMVNALDEREASSRCTTLDATGKTTRDGETYAAQSWDGMKSEWWWGENPDCNLKPEERMILTSWITPILGYSPQQGGTPKALVSTGAGNTWATPTTSCRTNSALNRR